ncbi:MAG: hypothetical protein KGK08_11840 [Acidobacteriota bacterium]|nr:hypothetical protein [Acidobacteriota bacterium]
MKLGWMKAAAKVALAVAAAAGVWSAVPSARAQALGASAPVTYKNKYELYGGLNYMVFRAGQTLPKRMNLGGAEVLGTYWVTPRWGVGVDYRGEAGTTQSLPNPYTTRPLVYMNILMGGAEYRGPKNQYAALNLHGYFGMAHGVFDATTGNIPAQYANVGLYSNSTKPFGAIGGSVDINRSKNWAIRLSPDLILDHFGNSERYYFAISGGVVHRFGKR